MADGNIENLVPFNERTEEEQREIARMGGIKSGEARRQKKLMKQIYAEFLEKKHNIIGRDGEKEEISGSDLLAKVMAKVLSRGDSASVSLMREIREATEGSNINITGEYLTEIIVEGVKPSVEKNIKTENIESETQNT